MEALPPFPTALRRYITGVFEKANRRVTGKIERVPNTPEESLDLTLIEHLSQYSGPRAVAPGWTVRIDVHFLGGMRHFREWEIADIGILIFAKKSGKAIARKVALLQSKRLYPDVGTIDEETAEDYFIGMGRLVSDTVSSPLATGSRFEFKPSSRYKVLKKDDGH